ncbi:EmrB/QacA family drug resistance transporter [Rhodococcus opacus M213]|uniref:EmrB/QacA family drug resistance transporter n=1 Tax=Rhodococcus opacus M213 TaxID=1129896 RepID=K8XF34_RHOOP|nr:MFS transporter [Rhodococcus opacus]EKT76907.1 EmrB/QacA family drug resistance transporter [Rhodococcus opacus M213]
MRLPTLPPPPTSDQAATDTRAGRVLALTSTGTMLVLLLTSGLNIALPSLRDQFYAGETALAWVLSGYTLAFAMLALTGGALADRFGARTVFAAGLTLFAGFSVLAAAAPTVVVVVVGTFGQGGGAALVLPAALSLVQQAYRDRPEKLPGAIGIWAGANAVGAALGPVVCGALVSLFSWRAMFLLVAILAGVCVLVGRTALPETAGGGGRLDLAGQVVTVALLGIIALLAHEGRHVPWWMSVVGGVAAVVLARVFVVVERRSPHPMLPIRQLRDTAFSANAVVTVIGTGAFFGALYVLSLALQDRLHMSAFVAGVALLPLAGGNVVAAVLAGRIMTRWGVRTTMIAGHLLLIAALCVCPLILEVYPALAAALVVLGIGWGLLVPATSAAGLARAHSGHEGIASGVTAGGRELGAALAAALLLPMGMAGLPVAAALGAASLLIAAAWVRRVQTIPQMPAH